MILGGASFSTGYLQILKHMLKIQITIAFSLASLLLDDLNYPLHTSNDKRLQRKLVNVSFVTFTVILSTS